MFCIWLHSSPEHSHVIYLKFHDTCISATQTLCSLSPSPWLFIVFVWVAGKTVWSPYYTRPYPSALEVRHDEALYKSTFTLLYFSWNSRVLNVFVCIYWLCDDTVNSANSCALSWSTTTSFQQFHVETVLVSDSPTAVIQTVIIYCDVAGCEWKTRYEMQVEMKQLLELQTAVLNEKVDEAKRTAKEGNSFQFFTKYRLLHMVIFTDKFHDCHFNVSLFDSQYWIRKSLGSHCDNSSHRNVIVAK